MATSMTRQNSVSYTHTLPNGLQMLGQFIPGVQSVASVFWVCTGTRDELAEEMGISHFLEHMAFRRSRNLRGDEIDRSFEEMGADHNAGTWLEMTFYWARVLNENLPRSLTVLSDLLRPVLDQEDFEQERNVILEEIARYDDMPTHILMQKFMQAFYGSSPLGRETLGTPETIKAMSAEQMRRYWRNRYGSNNTLFAVAGKFDWESVVKQVEELTRDWEPAETGRTITATRFEPALHTFTRDKFAQQQIALGVPSPTMSDPRYYAAALLATILGDDTGSRLYWAIQQTGLAESATAGVMEFEDNGLLLVHLSTEPDLADKALRVAREEMERLQQFDVQPDELHRAKAKLNSAVVIGGESTNDRVMGLIRSWLAVGRLETLEDIRQKIESVSLDDLRALLRDFPISPHQVIVSVGPLVEGRISVDTVRSL